MIKRVFGKVDGTEVILHQDGDRWTVPVPIDSNGEYVVEILAEDEAGNISYMAKMLFAVNGGLVSAQMVSIPYMSELQEGTTAHLFDRLYSAEMQLSHINAALIEKQYNAEIVDCRR
jgi:hypothetical protein